MKIFMIARFFILMLLVSSIPLTAGAVTFVEGPPSNAKAGVGQIVMRTIYIDTEGENINAIEGNVSYDDKRLVFESVADGDSVVSVWIKKLSSKEKGVLSFSGIIPGGYAGNQGKLFTLYFKALDVGDGHISMSGGGYSNDGRGTRVAVNTLVNSISVVSGSVAGLATEIERDIDAPHSIKAVIAQNESMFGGMPFIIVDAKDGNSGIERYELFQSDSEHSVTDLKNDDSLSWVTIGNPEALKSPIGKYLYVRAIDRAGNSVVAEVIRGEELSPESGEGGFNEWGGFAILMGGLVVLYLLYRLIKPHHAK